MQGVTKRLKVSDKWVARQTPSINNLEASTPVGTPTGQHATRQLHANIATPGGGEQQFSDEVRYSLPPADGEDEAAAKRRADRHRSREQLVVEQRRTALSPAMSV